MPNTSPRVAIIGAGVGGLAAAIALAASGTRVTVFERQPSVGGKLRTIPVRSEPVDAGPTVLTMPSVFEELFELAGRRLRDHMTLRPLDILARHWWPDGSTLDLYADRARSSRAIADFAGQSEAAGFRTFAQRAERIWTVLEPSFIRVPRPTLAGLVARAGPSALARISPFSTMSRAIARHFADPRLRQLFGRYATYCGSSPDAAPATLILIAHLEMSGVWTVDGGMSALGDALAGLARMLGVELRTGTEAAEVTLHSGCASGVLLASGERIVADAVLFAADAEALRAGKLGESLRSALPAAFGTPSLSALTWAAQIPRATIGLHRHNLFFPTHPTDEFDALIHRRRLPDAPTIYLCAQDRPWMQPDQTHERIFCLVNAPPIGHRLQDAEIDRCQDHVFRRLADLGIALTSDCRRTTPADFETLFPASQGALYGQSTHGWRSSFRRPGARSRIPGLYLAGGSVHPGAGLPMAVISGRLAASALTADLASTATSRTTVISGGMSTRSARTADMRLP